MSLTNISSPSAHLDALLTHYLTLLDRHERLRARAHQHLRAGHLSLAEANVKGSGLSRAGQRFGRDMYDEGRMRATFVVEVGGGEAASSSARGGGPDGGGRDGGGQDASEQVVASLLPWSMVGRWLPTATATGRHKAADADVAQNEDGRSSRGVTTEDDKPSPSRNNADPDPHRNSDANGPVTNSTSTNSPRSAATDASVQLPTPPTSRGATPAAPTEPPSLSNLSINEASSSSSADADPASPPSTSTSPLPPDPIRQFGILVPPALRTAQAAFRRSLLEERGEGEEDDVGGWVEIAVLDAQLKALEVEIRRARKRLRKGGEGNAVEKAIG